jgi:hypothetical protein
MNTRPDDPIVESSVKAWMKRAAWALPLFFLIKGLMWLAVPAVFLFFSIE